MTAVLPASIKKELYEECEESKKNLKKHARGF